MSRDGMAGFLRQSPGVSASGPFVPKPSPQAPTLGQVRSWPTRVVHGVRRRSLESAADSGDSHSLGYSALPHAWPGRGTSAARYRPGKVRADYPLRPEFQALEQAELLDDYAGLMEPTPRGVKRALVGSWLNRALVPSI